MQFLLVHLDFFKTTCEQEREEIGIITIFGLVKNFKLVGLFRIKSYGLNTLRKKSGISFKQRFIDTHYTNKLLTISIISRYKFIAKQSLPLSSSL